MFGLTTYLSILTTFKKHNMPIKTCMPPDGNPKKPSIKVPALACDAHCHVFGPRDVFPYQ